MTIDEKQTFTTSHARGGAANNVEDTGLALPWRGGEAWFMGGGPHGYSGRSRPFNSLDFSGGDGRVLSPARGRFYKTCVRNGSAEIRLVHDNGYTTSYYHMTNLPDVADGTLVAAGTYLGRIGVRLPCGGSANGPHVHMSLYRGRTPIPVHGKTIGGWTFWQGRNPYEGRAEHDGRSIGTGGRLTNYGGTLAPTQATGIARPRPGTDKVNLRSGPGLDHRIIGTVRNGDVVEIACTARGERLKGNWGHTDLWNKLDADAWISDGFLDTGTNNPVAPPCQA
ncbi:peptidoglycan DD-metalloendopeptidase family protein [Nocardia brasiliensis]|uniref:peptidoglycan DD-metalloendopeptidase family protein n=1 Tax=Nocardia brasiliensis TaxID=37326 RepID=UPI002455457F|nr:peptidoglycan DD-metalloendopeptidase family protein [Nocardia brasiliensis]